VIGKAGLHVVTTVLQKVKLACDIRNKKLHYFGAAYFKEPPAKSAALASVFL
jgi:hypothetical protein